MSSKNSIPPPIFTLRGHEVDVTALHLLENLSEPYLVSGDLNGSIIVWNLLTYRITTRSDMLTNGKILSIKQIFERASSSISYLVIQSRMGHVKLVLVEELKSKPDDSATVVMQEINSYPSSTLLFSRGDAITIADRAYLAHSSIIEECQIALRVLDINLKTLTSTPVKRPKSKDAKSAPSCFDVKLVTLTEGIIFILCGYEDGVLCVFTCDTNTKPDETSENCTNSLNEMHVSLIKCINTEFKEFISSFDYYINSSLLVCASPLDKILLTEIGFIDQEEVEKVSGSEATTQLSDKIKSRFKYLDLRSSGVSQISFRPDGKLFAVALWNSQVRLYSSKKLKLLAILSNHVKQVDSILFIEDKWSLTIPKQQISSSDNIRYLMICASNDKTISLWSLFNDS